MHACKNGMGWEGQSAKEWGGWGTGCGAGVRGSVGVGRKAACEWQIGVGKNSGDRMFAGVKDWSRVGVRGEDWTRGVQEEDF